MGTIKILDEKTRLKIAAGEVVQRPASVVKELLENAIDAHSTKIVVNITKGGKHLIEVIDDGEGIPREDIEVAFQRYSTSKISSITDLEMIHTLGFRGEALASIAAVSNVELITKTSSLPIGTRIHVQGGEILKVEDASHARGTTVRVSNLFFNVPARLKFLKTSQAEFQIILDIITNYSLLYTGIHFILTHNNEEVLNSAAVPTQLDKIFFIYGKDVAKNMIPIEYQTNLLKISGFISKPIIRRGTRKSYSIFVNDRLISSKLITDAIDDVYKSILPRNQHPIIVLALTIDSRMIDVNVHPAKEEVKFSQELLVSDTFRKALTDSLAREKLIPQLEVRERPKDVSHDKTSPERSSIEVPAKSLTIQTTLSPRVETEQLILSGSEVKSVDKLQKSKLPQLKIIGQSHQLFILASDEENLYIIDQHAAHERVMFEKFLKKLDEGPLQVQTLLEPIIIEFPLHDSLKITQKLPFLREFGFDFELFGKNTYKITKLPVILGKMIKPDEIQLVVDELLEKVDIQSKKIPSREELAQLYGCKAAIKQGERLSLKQMEGLYNALRKTSNPYVCAHNRPTIITFAKDELERKFHR